MCLEATTQPLHFGWSLTTVGYMELSLRKYNSLNRYFKFLVNVVN